MADSSRTNTTSGNMEETSTDQIVDDAAPALHEYGRTFDVIDIGPGNNLNWRRVIVKLVTRSN